jgi:hypothetical protein
MSVLNNIFYNILMETTPMQVHERVNEWGLRAALSNTIGNPELRQVQDVNAVCFRESVIDGGAPVNQAMLEALPEQDIFAIREP